MLPSPVGASETWLVSRTLSRCSPLSSGHQSTAPWVLTDVQGSYSEVFAGLILIQQGLESKLQTLGCQGH